jgi:hypothetical protein
MLIRVCDQVHDNQAVFVLGGDFTLIKQRSMRFQSVHTVSVKINVQLQLIWLFINENSLHSISTTWKVIQEQRLWLQSFSTSGDF